MLIQILLSVLDLQQGIANCSFIFLVQSHVQCTYEPNRIIDEVTAVTMLIPPCLWFTFVLGCIKYKIKCGDM